MIYKDIIIIGGGPAGLTAGLYATRAGLSVMLIERLFAGGQIATTHSLENFPGFPNGIAGPDFSMKIEEQATNFGLEIVYENVVEYHLTGAIKKITTDENQYTAGSIILAMGAQPRPLNVKGEEEFSGRGVSYCATCDGAFFKNKTVAVIGGGDTACEDADYLAKLCKKVYLVHRRDQLRAVGVIAQRMHNIENIEILWNAIVEEVKGSDTVEGIILHNKITNENGLLDVDGVFVAVGLTPNTYDLKGQVKLNSGNYIISDKYMATNIHGVYVAGDIRDTPLRQVVTACSDGSIAAESARLYLNEHT